jgi:hypothetical protein
MKASVRPDYNALIRAEAKFRRLAEQRLLDESHRAAEETLNQIREEMAAAGLGRLGNALGFTSDRKRGRGVHRSGSRVSASGVVHIRSGSPRSRGAIEAYTGGAEIAPKRGRWLWIASDDIPALAGRGKERGRMTPELYNEKGFATKIGPLVFVMSKGGTPLLIVKNVGVNAAGMARSAKSLTKKGLPRKGQVAMDFVVAFYGIPKTTRQARVNPKVIAAEQAQRMGRRLRSF